MCMWCPDRVPFLSTGRGSAPDRPVATGMLITAPTSRRLRSSCLRIWPRANAPNHRHPAPDAVKAAGREAAELCRQRGASLATLGMQFCLREPRIPTTISGAARAEEIDANVRAMERPIDEGLLRDVLASFEPVRDVTWASGKSVKPSTAGEPGASATGVGFTPVADAPGSPRDGDGNP